MKIFLSFLAFFVLLVSASLVFSYSQIQAPQNSPSDRTTFIIKPGETTQSVLARLQESKIIRSATIARLYLKLTGQERKFVPGEFGLSSSLPLIENLNTLLQGPQDVSITFPEGWRREQIAAHFSKLNPDFSVPDFLAATASLEGQLFPDTYHVPRAITAAQAIQLMTSNFQKKSGLNLLEPKDKNLLIIASLIEREAKDTTDRALISSVIFNRLQIGMALQIDATVQYALDSQRCSRDLFSCTWWQPIYDTKAPSLYNTYLHPGLPPAPIANPGLLSIQAAKNPDTSSYLYYLTGTDGKTRFAKDLPTHQSNVDKYLRP